MQKDDLENDGITLGQLFNVMFGRKLILLIVTLCIFVLGTIIFKFAYNDNNETYTAQFTYSEQDLVNGSYFDGTTFNYREIIGRSNLESVKASDDSYSNINIDDMYDNGDIKIQNYTTYVVINNEETTTVDDRYYTIVVKSKYFKDQNQAKDFLNNLISFPLNRNETIISNSDYKSNLRLYSSASTFEDQIIFLQRQLALLQSNYQQLIQKYGNVSLSDGSKLQNVLNEIDAAFQTTTLSSLQQEVVINGYVKDYDSDYISQLTVVQADLERRIKITGDNLTTLTEQRDAILNSLQDTSMQQIDISSYNNQIIALTIELSNLTNELADVTRKLNAETTKSDKQDEFVTRLNKYSKQLEDYTTEYQSNELEVVSSFSGVDFYNTSIVVQGGTISILIVAVMFLVLGFVIACCVNLVLDGKKLSKNYVEELKKEIE